jgi:hypothetical protein
VAPGFGRPRSTSGLGLWENQNSNLAYLQLLLPGAVNLLTCVLLNRNDRELLRVSGLRENQISNLLCLQLLLPGAMDLLMRGPTDGWSRFTSGLRHFWLGSLMLRHFGTFHFGGGHFRDFDFRTLTFRHFRTLATSRLWGHFGTLGHFRLRPFGTLTSTATSGLRPLRDFGHFDTSGLRALWHFGPLGNSCTSHFKTPEAHFPEHLDRMPPVPFKIYDSCLFRDFGIFPSLYLVQF